jgi:hypothetical protein
MGPDGRRPSAHSGCRTPHPLASGGWSAASVIGTCGRVGARRADGSCAHRARPTPVSAAPSTPATRRSRSRLRLSLSRSACRMPSSLSFLSRRRPGEVQAGGTPLAQPLLRRGSGRRVRGGPSRARLSGRRLRRRRWPSSSIGAGSSRRARRWIGGRRVRSVATRVPMHGQSWRSRLERQLTTSVTLGHLPGHPAEERIPPFVHVPKVPAVALTETLPAGALAGPDPRRRNFARPSTSASLGRPVRDMWGPPVRAAVQTP